MAKQVSLSEQRLLDAKIRILSEEMVSRMRGEPILTGEGALRLEFFRVPKGRQMLLTVRVSDLLKELNVMVDLETIVGNCFTLWCSNRYTLSPGEHTIYIPLPMCPLVHMALYASQGEMEAARDVVFDIVDLRFVLDT